MLWKASMMEGIILEGLKVGLITPIHKGGARDRPQNYRPVTLTSHVIKVFEKVVARRLVQYMEEADLYNNGQWFPTKSFLFVTVTGAPSPSCGPVGRGSWRERGIPGLS
jgi:hypothetical protein